MPDRERKRDPDDRSDVLKGCLPLGPPAHLRNTEDPSIRGCTERREREGEERQSNTERYRGAVPETMWNYVRGICIESGT